MSKQQVSCDDQTRHIDGPTAVSLADVANQIPSFSDVPERSRANMMSSVRTLCRVLDRQPWQVPVAAAAFREAIKEAKPGAFGVGVRHWKNVLSNTRRAIRLSGLGGKRPALSVPLTEEWDRLISILDDRWSKSTITRLAMFCCACQIAPGEVDDTIVERYRNYLDETRLARDPEDSIRILVRYWNKCHEQHAGWPNTRLARPDRSRTYALNWDELPQSLGEEVKQFHEESLNPDLFDPDAPRPVKPITIRQRDGLLRRLAAAQVANGVPKEELKSLADLVCPRRLKLGLRFFLDRNGGEISRQIHVIVNLAYLIASRKCQLSDDELHEIKGFCHRLTFKCNGLTKKNKERLRQFADDRVVSSLVNLPAQLVAKAQRMRPSRKQAATVQVALAIEILLFAPIRVHNLMRLDRNQHFAWARQNGNKVLHLIIPAEEVKNNVDLEFPLPVETEELLDLYMSTYQPKLVVKPSSFLFPGSKGGPKRENGFWLQLQTTIRRELGIEMNPHLFRHFGALLHLEANPGEYEVVRRVLGHRSINTTVQNYAGLETAAAARHFDETILRYKSPNSSALDEPEDES